MVNQINYSFIFISFFLARLTAYQQILPYRACFEHSNDINNNTHISYHPSSLIQASHYSSLYMIRMMRLKVKVSICVCRFSVHSGCEHTITLSFNKQSKKR